jgi:hypothetical protein
MRSRHARVVAAHAITSATHADFGRIVSRQMARLPPPMIDIVAAILKRLRCSPQIIAPAVAAANGGGINVCEVAVDVTLPRAWCQPA